MVERDARERPSEVARPLPGQFLRLDFETVSGANPAVPGTSRPGGQADRRRRNWHGSRELSPYEPFSVSLWINSPGNQAAGRHLPSFGAWTDAASRGYELLLEDDRLSAALIHFWPGNAMRVQAVDPLAGQHVDARRGDVRRIESSGGIADLTSMGVPIEVDVVRDNLNKNITGGGGDHITIGERFRDRGFANGLVDEFQVFDRQLTPLEIAQLADGQTLADALHDARRTTFAGRSATVYGVLICPPSIEPFRQRWQQLQELAAATQRDRRPDSRDHGDARVARAAADASAVARRLRRTGRSGPAADTGQSLEVSRRMRRPIAWDWPSGCAIHSIPLTARVAVNRYWQMIFGEGLVRTPEDFGSQGRPPTHPDLLDWLARDFIDHGWDLKRLLKQMVMSATYRQSSWPIGGQAASGSGKSVARPDAPAYRWPAEMLRDNALLGQRSAGVPDRRTSGQALRSRGGLYADRGGCRAMESIAAASTRIGNAPDRRR